jgi:CubicO group peptidase (beta-lactamase class C family)
VRERGAHDSVYSSAPMSLSSTSSAPGTHDPSSAASEPPANRAPWPATGSYADGFRPIAKQFAKHLAEGQEIGANLAVYHHGRLVVDLAGGLADVKTRRPYERDTRLVVFSVTKGFAAMALNLLADRGQLDWDAPAASYWPAFAKNGKATLSLRTLFAHQGGLAALDTPLTLDDCLHRPERVRQALEDQRPAEPPVQAYHGITFGMLAAELFARIAGETMGEFLRRELFVPLGSDVHLGTPPELDPLFATLYPPHVGKRLAKGLFAALVQPETPDGRLARSVLARTSLPRAVFQSPSLGARGILAYNDVPVRRAELPWGSATASALGVARAYLPWSLGGAYGGRRYVREETVSRLRERDGWSERDAVLQRPLGWNRGFLKEEGGVFAAHEAGFGHAGMGGALGWCDPEAELAMGYVMNRMDWRIRSPRALALCRALSQCGPVAAERAPRARR